MEQGIDENGEQAICGERRASAFGGIIYIILIECAEIQTTDNSEQPSCGMILGKQLPEI